MIKVTQLSSASTQQKARKRILNILVKLRGPSDPKRLSTQLCVRCKHRQRRLQICLLASPPLLTTKGTRAIRRCLRFKRSSNGHNRRSNIIISLRLHRLIISNNRNIHRHRPETMTMESRPPPAILTRGIRRRREIDTTTDTTAQPFINSNGLTTVAITATQPLPLP